MTGRRKRQPFRGLQTTPPSSSSPGGFLLVWKGKNHAILRIPLQVLLAQMLSVSVRVFGDSALLRAFFPVEQEACQLVALVGRNRQRRESVCGSDKLAWNIAVGGGEPSWRSRKAPIPERLGGRSAPHSFHSPEGSFPHS